MSAKKRPSRWWYALAALLLAAAVALPGIGLWKFVTSFLSSGRVVTLPGREEIALEAGSYMIFREFQASADRSDSGGSAPLTGFSCTIVRADTGEPVEFETPTGSFTYSVGGRKGVGLWAADIDEPGTYVISGSYDDPSQRDRPVVLRVTGWGSFGAMVTPVVAGALCFLAAIAVFIVTLVKRSSRAATAPPPLPPGARQQPPQNPYE